MVNYKILRLKNKIFVKVRDLCNKKMVTIDHLLEALVKYQPQTVNGR